MPLYARWEDGLGYVLANRETGEAITPLGVWTTMRARALRVVFGWTG